MIIYLTTQQLCDLRQLTYSLCASHSCCENKWNLFALSVSTLLQVTPLLFTGGLSLHPAPIQVVWVGLYPQSWDRAYDLGLPIRAGFRFDFQATASRVSHLPEQVQQDLPWLSLGTLRQKYLLLSDGFQSRAPGSYLCLPQWFPLEGRRGELSSTHHPPAPPPSHRGHLIISGNTFGCYKSKNGGGEGELLFSARG